jgi:Putative transposase
MNAGGMLTFNRARRKNYAGRYVRRPPLAQYRILTSTEREISFRTNDHKQKREVITRYTPREFIGLLADHVPGHYQHAIRHFGLLGPRSKSHTFGAIFVQLGQQRRPRPRHLSWAYSIEREYGINPLLDSQGERMHLIARRSFLPVIAADTLSLESSSDLATNSRQPP